MYVSQYAPNDIFILITVLSGFDFYISNNLTICSWTLKLLNIKMFDKA
jgi:hypothetical protein